MGDSCKIFAFLFMISFALLGCSRKEEGKSTPVELEIPFGSSIIADGNLDEFEWVDAKKVEIVVQGRENVEVWIKHDNENLLLLFNLHNPSVSAVLFPEMLFDTNNDKSSSWMNDDWWFHVSASDCVAQGSFNNYANCEVDQPDWFAVPNYPSGIPGMVNTIEVVIPFLKIGITKDTKFGFTVLVTNTVNLWKCWPENAKNNNPSTWCDAIIL